MSNGLNVKIKRLHKLFIDGKIEGPEEHEVHPNLPKGSTENYIYFTLPCALNFQRSSPVMWKAALKTYNDFKTNYLFFPEKVVKEDYAKVKSDLRKHGLSVQTNKHCKIWVTLSETLNKHYNNDPKEVLKECDFNVPDIIKHIQKDKKPLFPYLSGPKLSNYWLFILSEFTDVKFENIEEISIIPDTHVIKSSIRLGVVSEANVDAKKVEAAWRPILKKLSIAPTEMHSALWRWSRENFKTQIE